jgi:hypothetical protein
VTYGLMVHRALDAAAALAKDGVEAEVIDLRTLSPLDIDTVLESVAKTGRLVCVDEANPRCSIACDVSAQVAQQAFGALKGPIEMVTPPHAPVPFSPVLEELYIPSAAQITAAARREAHDGRREALNGRFLGHHAHRDAQVGPGDARGHGLAPGWSTKAREIGGGHSPSSTSRPTRSPTPSRHPTRGCCAAQSGAGGRDAAGQGAAGRARRCRR